jgi:sec-independent protein translocase protein TatA
MIGSLSPWHWLVILFVALLLFGGRGKLSGLMGDAARGIKSFRDELKDTKPSAAAAEPAQIPARNEAAETTA